jgi:hypothetical protein
METIAAELRRQHQQIWYIVAAIALVAALTVGLVIGWMLHGQRRDNAPAPAPAVQPQAPSSQTSPQNSPEQPAGSAGPALQAQQPAPAPAPKQYGSGNKTPSSNIDVQAIQNAVSGMSQRGGQKNSSSQQGATGAATRTADRYPGSQTIDMKEAAIPDFGIPVSNQVYSTSDSLATVMAYYKQLYPDAQVMEISGQNIIAVDRPGETKVIAIGTSGSETRIAIVQPGN